MNLSKGHVDRIVLSPQELVLLARLVHAEAAGEPFRKGRGGGYRFEPAKG